MKLAKSLATCTLAILTLSFFSSASLSSELKKTALAQRNQSTLESDLGFSNGFFASYVWSSANDRREIYTSEIYVTVERNTMSIYNTYNREPLGRIANCGGLGCDLGQGSLLATLDFVKQGNTYIVKNASQRASFLEGSRCKVVESYLPVLECFSSQAPVNDRGQGYLNMPSIIQFLPGT